MFDFYFRSLLSTLYSQYVGIHFIETKCRLRWAVIVKRLVRNFEFKYHCRQWEFVKPYILLNSTHFIHAMSVTEAIVLRNNASEIAAVL